MLKRKYDEIYEAETVTDKRKQHSLDSDEEDEEIEEENYNVLDESNFQGFDEGLGEAEKIGFTAFNVIEEEQEGRFDKDGNYIWNKEKEIRDNWVDRLDDIEIYHVKEGKGGLTDSDSDSDDTENILFDAMPLYKQMLEYMQPGETVSKALCRLGGGKMSTAERWKRRKDPKAAEEDKEKSEQITKFTELANQLLTKTGNMDIYQESYEQIKKKVELSGKQSHPSKQEAEFDMYADDFEEKEKSSLEEKEDDSNENKEHGENKSETDELVTWELKWSQEDDAEIYGPHTTEQMQAWAKEGYFKRGAWVRRNGQSQFYSALRIDFEIYI